MQKANRSEPHSAVVDVEMHMQKRDRDSKRARVREREREKLLQPWSHVCVQVFAWL